LTDSEDEVDENGNKIIKNRKKKKKVIGENG
jgi:hypothetical protein